MFEKGDLVIGGIVGVAKWTASRIPSIEFPEIINASREPACGARKTVPVWEEEKVQRPGKQKIKAIHEGRLFCQSSAESKASSIKLS